jgi:hypothetical protein
VVGIVFYIESVDLLDLLERPGGRARHRGKGLGPIEDATTDERKRKSASAEERFGSSPTL